MRLNIAIIPARGGSKRIPRKNIRRFHGQPMIIWSIKAAQASGLFDRIIVSTDDLEIADVAKDAGAEVPFLRPDALSNDFATTGDVIKHALSALVAQGSVYRFACCLYATAPFVTPEAIRRGHDAMQGGAAYAFSVTEYAFPIQRALRRQGEGVEMFDPKYALTRAQDLEPAFHDAGQFYWGRCDAWAQALPIFAPHSVPIPLPRHDVVDIDTEDDWVLAEKLFAVR